MKQVTLNIPDNRYAFFMELISNLGLDESEDIHIPEEHKAIVRERIEKSKKDPNRLLNWEQVKNDFKFD